MIVSDRIKKQNAPAPIYTSYSTVHYRKTQNWNKENWISPDKKFPIESSTDGIGSYIYLPFCESLCTYCGCTHV